VLIGVTLFRQGSGGLATLFARRLAEELRVDDHQQRAAMRTELAAAFQANGMCQ
jgi:hypothetical protein